MHENPSDDALRAILLRPMTVAVVGCSPDATRDSHRIAALLQSRGHRMVPIHPDAGEILGEPCHRSLRDLPVSVDMVDVFRRPDAVPEIVADVIAIGAPILWLQLGVVHEGAAVQATAAGVTVIMNRCPAIEYRRLFGSGDRV